MSTPDAGGATPDFPPPIPSRTPQLLRRLQVVAALAVLVAGLACAWVVVDLRNDLAAVPNLAQQYARLGQVQHSLTRAAILADRSALAGEAADGPLAEAVTDELVTASGLLVAAGRDRPQDAAALTGLSQDVTRYALLLNSAAGAARADAVPVLDRSERRLDALDGDIAAIQASLAAEAGARPWSQGSPLPVLVALAMLGVLGWVASVVARRSRRVLNLGLVAAALALLVGVGLTAAAQAGAAAASEASRDTQFGHVVNATSAVTALGSAHRAVTSAVLAGDWTESRRAAYAAAYHVALDAAAREDVSGVKGFHAAAGEVTGLLAKGEEKEATALLLADGDDSVDALAEAFAAKAHAVAADAAAEAATEPGNARNSMVSQLVMVIVAALAGAALAVLGLDRRLKEYR